MKNFWRAFRYFRAEAPLLAVVLGLIVLGAVLSVLKPWPLSLIVDCVFGTRATPAWLQALPAAVGKPALIGWLAGLVLFFHFGQGAVAALYNYFSIKTGLRGLTRVRNEVFQKLLGLSLQFHHGAPSGDVIYRASWDTYAFQTYFQQGWITFLTALVSLLMMVGVMARLNLRLTLIALGTVPFLLLVIQRFGSRMSARGKLAQQADSRVTSLVQENITALQVIQSYTGEPGEIRRFEAQTRVAERTRLAQHGAEVLYGLAITAVFASGTAAIVWQGAEEVVRGSLTVGQLLIFTAYLAQLYEPLNQLSHVGATLSSAAAGMSRVFELLDAPEEIVSSPGARRIRRADEPASGQPEMVLRGEIKFSGVHFAYRPGQEVLRGIDLVIKPGESVALIGPSGAGKTTLVNLVARFFDPSQGTVFLDGFDLKTLRVPDLRARMAMVLQEPILLTATISENIAYAKPDASLEEIQAAARAAQAEEFIRRLPDQYDTMVGEGASRLSVGEKQRLSLARAFLKNAPILLLDEPTSALDRESEQLVVRALEQLMRGRTTLMVAHRLATIRSASRIVVFADGRIMETGTHEELVCQGKYFARLHTSTV